MFSWWLTLIKSSQAISHVSLLKTINVSGTFSVPTIRAIVWSLAVFNELTLLIAGDAFLIFLHSYRQILENNFNMQRAIIHCVLLTFPFHYQMRHQMIIRYDMHLTNQCHDYKQEMKENSFGATLMGWTYCQVSYKYIYVEIIIKL
jgi:hypothetical protein